MARLYSFVSNGKTYDIPENEIGAFKADNPDAERVFAFHSGDTTYDIPESEVDAFLRDMPDAQARYAIQNLNGSRSEVDGLSWDNALSDTQYRDDYQKRHKFLSTQRNLQARDLQNQLLFAEREFTGNRRLTLSEGDAAAFKSGETREDWDRMPIIQGRIHALNSIVNSGKFLTATKEEADAIAAAVGEISKRFSKERGLGQRTWDAWQHGSGRLVAGIRYMGNPEALAAMQAEMDATLPKAVGGLSEIHGFGDAASWLLENTADQAPQVAAAMGAGMLTGGLSGVGGAIARTAAVGATMVPQNWGEAVAGQVNEGREFDPAAAAFQTGIYSALDSVGGVARMAKRTGVAAKALRSGGLKAARSAVADAARQEARTAFRETFNRTLGQTLKEVGKDALMEGVTEGGQTLLGERPVRYYQTGSFFSPEEQEEIREGRNPAALALMAAAEEGFTAAVTSGLLGVGSSISQHNAARQEVRHAERLGKTIAEAADAANERTRAEADASNGVEADGVPTRTAESVARDLSIARELISSESFNALDDADKVLLMRRLSAQAGLLEARELDRKETLEARRDNPDAKKVTRHSDKAMAIINGVENALSDEAKEIEDNFFAAFDINGQMDAEATKNMLSRFGNEDLQMVPTSEGPKYYCGDTGITITPAVHAMKNKQGSNDYYIVRQAPGKRTPLGVRAFGTMGEAVKYAQDLDRWNQQNEARLKYVRAVAEEFQKRLGELPGARKEMAEANGSVTFLDSFNPYLLDASNPEAREYIERLGYLGDSDDARNRQNAHDLMRYRNIEGVTLQGLNGPHAYVSLENVRNPYTLLATMLHESGHYKIAETLRADKKGADLRKARRELFKVDDDDEARRAEEVFVARQARLSLEERTAMQDFFARLQEAFAKVGLNIGDMTVADVNSVFDTLEKMDSRRQDEPSDAAPETGAPAMPTEAPAAPSTPKSDTPATETKSGAAPGNANPSGGEAEVKPDKGAPGVEAGEEKGEPAAQPAPQDAPATEPEKPAPSKPAAKSPADWLAEKGVRIRKSSGIDASGRPVVTKDVDTVEGVLSGRILPEAAPALSQQTRKELVGKLGKMGFRVNDKTSDAALLGNLLARYTEEAGEAAPASSPAPAATPQKPVEVKPAAPAATKNAGGTFRVKTPNREMSVEGKWEAVPADKIVTSFDPRYGQFEQDMKAQRLPPDVERQLQNRDDTGDTNEEKVRSIANDPDYDLLNDSPTSGGTGAPFGVWYKGLCYIIAGNHRARGVQLSFQTKHGDGYKTAATADMSRRGVKVPAGDFLAVRILDPDSLPGEKLYDFTDASNKTAMQEKRNGEKAVNDILAVKKHISKLRPDEKLSSKGNQEFVEALMGVFKDESLRGADKEPTDEAYRRIRRALVATMLSATNDPASKDLVRIFSEKADKLELDNIINGVTAAAAPISSATEAAKGTGLDFGKALADALRAIVDFRQSGGKSMKAFLAQENFEFGDRQRLSEEAGLLAQAIAENANAPRRIGELLADVAARVEKAVANSAQGNLFGEEESPSLATVIRAAIDATSGKAAESDIAFLRNRAPALFDALWQGKDGTAEALAEVERQLNRIRDAKDKTSAMRSFEGEARKLAGKYWSAEHPAGKSKLGTGPVTVKGEAQTEHLNQKTQETANEKQATGTNETPQAGERGGDRAQARANAQEARGKAQSNAPAQPQGVVKSATAAKSEAPAFAQETVAGVELSADDVKELDELATAIVAHFSRGEENAAQSNENSSRFDEELQRQIDGTLPKGHVYQLGRPGAILRSTGIPDLPIQLSATRLAEKSKDAAHPFDLGDVRGLVKALQVPVAIFTYGDKAKAQNLIVEISSNGKNFLVGISLNPQVDGRVLNVNSIRNVFPKDTAEWLHWIKQDKLLYADKEKIQAIIGQQRINLADVAYLDLDHVNSILDSFKNPQAENEADVGDIHFARGDVDAEAVNMGNKFVNIIVAKKGAKDFRTFAGFANRFFYGKVEGERRRGLQNFLIGRWSQYLVDNPDSGIEEMLPSQMRAIFDELDRGSAATETQPRAEKGKEGAGTQNAAKRIVAGARVEIDTTTGGDVNARIHISGIIHSLSHDGIRADVAYRDGWGKIEHRLFSVDELSNADIDSSMVSGGGGLFGNRSISRDDMNRWVEETKGKSGVRPVADESTSSKIARTTEELEAERAARAEEEDSDNYTGEAAPANDEGGQPAPRIGKDYGGTKAFSAIRDAMGLNVNEDAIHDFLNAKTFDEGMKRLARFGVEEATARAAWNDAHDIKPNSPQAAETEAPAHEPEPNAAKHTVVGKPLTPVIAAAPTSYRARLAANIEAIRIAKELDETGRTATEAEREKLAKFTGWGGMGRAFNEDYDDRARLLAVLTPEEMSAAELSANSAYFTPTKITTALWDIARALGFKGGRMLEGSAGVGNIISAIPQDLRAKTDIQAVEIDPMTALILKGLHPQIDVDVAGFQDVNVPAGSVNLAITNVPFVTGLRVYDKANKDLSERFKDLHDFCIAKNIRTLAEGGLGIFITTSNTLDKSDSLRQWITSQGNADVIGAFRLPNDTFGGTKVTSDIIVVRKRIGGQKSAGAIDVSAAPVERTTGYFSGKPTPMYLNKYFHDHPEMMGGEMAFNFEKGDTYREASYGLFPSPDIDADARFADFVKSMERKRQDMGAARKDTAEGERHTFELADETIHEGELHVVNGEVCIARGGESVSLGGKSAQNKVSGANGKGKFTRAAVVKDYSDIKAALHALLDAQKDIGRSDAAIESLMKKLNDAYDWFVKRYGPLNLNNRIGWLDRDIFWPELCALEEVVQDASPGNDGYAVTIHNQKDGIYTHFRKSDVFRKRVISVEKAQKPANVTDAVLLDYRNTANISARNVAMMLGISEEDASAQILKSGLAFIDPATGALSIRHDYLSGNVREKLAIAEAQNADGRYDANIKALNEVLPPTIPAHLIGYALGSTWLPKRAYTAFFADKFDVNIRLDNAGGQWIVDLPGYATGKNFSEGVYSSLTGKRISGAEIAAAAMRGASTIQVVKTEKIGENQTQTVHDRAAEATISAKIDEYRDDFKSFVQKMARNDEAFAAEVEGIYNERFNNLAKRVIDDRFLPDRFEGANPAVTLYPHQKRAVILGTTQPVMLAHEVGSGKTFTLITTAMEMRRLGTARKPMVVVQNATIGQFVASAKFLYPGARILAPSKGDTGEEGRREFYAKAKFNDWDMIIVPQSMFGMIPDSDESQETYLKEKIEEKRNIKAALPEGIQARGGANGQGNRRSFGAARQGQGQHEVQEEGEGPGAGRREDEGAGEAPSRSQG